MSLSGAINVALSGLQTASTAVQLISGNVSNSQTDGFTKKSLSLQPVMAGTTLGGVEVTGYQRVTNEVLTATLNTASSNASYLSTQSNYLAQVQSLLDSTGNPPVLSEDLSEFQAAWTEYASNPSDPTIQKNVIAAGQNLASTISTISTQVTDLEVNVQNDLVSNVDGLNTALETVHTLNIQITTALSNNQPTVNLEDERDLAINEIAKYTNVTVMDRANGQIALYTPGGTVLLDQTPRTFTVSPNGNTILNEAGSDVTGSLGGGSLQAQTDFLATTATSANGVGIITKLNSQLQNFTNMFIATTAGGDSFADVYNAASTVSGDLASSFFTANVDSNGLPDLSSFKVNDALVNGTSNVKAAAAVDIAGRFNATDVAVTTTWSGAAWVYTTSSTFTAAGITMAAQTYTGIATNILSGFQQAANTVKNKAETASTQEAYYRSSLSSETGVNTDTELVNLTAWQNSYAASAHVISTIQTMMEILENMVN